MMTMIVHLGLLAVAHWDTAGEMINRGNGMEALDHPPIPKLEVSNLIGLRKMLRVVGKGTRNITAKSRMITEGLMLSSERRTQFSTNKSQC